MSVEIRIAPLERAHLAKARELLATACAHDRAAEVAEELLFAPGLDHEAHPMAAFVGQRDLGGVAVVSGPWLRLLAVAPAWRGRGVGSALLHAAERDIARLLAESAASAPRVVRVMDQPGNYLAPGVDARNSETIDWLVRRGYRERRVNHNLIVDLVDNEAVSEDRARDAARAAAARGYGIRRATERDRALLMHVIGREFGQGWAFEVGRALAFEPAAVHLACSATGDSLAGFAAHDGNNQGLGWFGPAGTLPEHRAQGLGKALLLACLVDIQRAGLRRAEIAWIGPREFYQRSVGVAGERRFVVLVKEICS